MTTKNLEAALTLFFITALMISSSFLPAISAIGPPDDDYGDMNGEPKDLPIPVDPPDVGDKIPGIGDFDGTTGYFVCFEVIEEGISNHEIKIGDDQYLTIFDEITIEDFGMYSEEILGYSYVLKGLAAEIRVYDNPSVSFVLNVGTLGSERTVSFKVGDLEILQNEHDFVRIAYGDYTGSIIPIVDGAPVGEPEIEDGYIRYKITDHTTFVFRLEIEGLMDAELSDFVNNNIFQGRFGAELRVESSRESYNYMFVPYRDVKTVARMRDKNTLDIMISSDTLGDKGTILLLDISYTAMDISPSEGLELDFNGEKVALVGDYSDLEDSNDPAYMVIIGEERFHILFNVPHFSAHTITVRHVVDVSEYLGSMLYYVPAAVFSAGIVMLGTIFFAKRGKKNRR